MASVILAITIFKEILSMSLQLNTWLTEKGQSYLHEKEKSCYSQA